ncbi:MAG: transglutaminase family protein [Acidobacteriota bacterium]
MRTLGATGIGCELLRRRRTATPRRIAWTAAALLLGATAGPVLATAATTVPVRLPLAVPAADRPEEDWYGVYAGGTKIGFLHTWTGRSHEGGVPTLMMAMDAEMKVKALGTPISMSMRETMVFAAEAPYRLRRGESEMAQGAYSRQVKMLPDGDGFSAVITEGDATRTMSLGPLDFTAEDALTPEAWFSTPRQAGARLVARSFAVSQLQSSIDTYEITAVRESVADGVPVRFYDVRQLSSVLGDVGLFRFDGSGHMLSGSLGQNLEIRLETRDQAHDADYEADLFVLGMARVDHPLGDPRTVSSLVLGVSSGAVDRLPAGPRQSVVKDAAGGVHLRLGEEWGVEDAEVVDDPGLYLQESVEHPVHAPAVVSLARSAIGDARTRPERVRALVRFVQTFIDDSYSAQPLSVMDILKVRRGDCTEHALLFTTLARSVGIPAREVAGLIYMGDDERAFGGHAWSEVIIDGRWVDVDPLWGETDINATHISFGPISGKDSGFLTGLSRFDFTVETVEHDRRPEPAR